MSLARHKPFYVSLGMKYNDHIEDTVPRLAETYSPFTDQGAGIVASPDVTKTAVLSDVFNHPLVDKASDYLVAVERMELSLNAIPFYDASPHMTFNTITPVQYRSERIYVHSRTNGVNPTYIELADNAYSLSHLFTLLGLYDFADPNSLTVINITVSIDKDGFIILSLLGNSSFDNLYFEFPRRLNLILGISIDVQYPGYSQAVSAFPRTDLGDDLDHLILVSNLPTHADSVGNEKLPILTDFCPPSTYGNSVKYDIDGYMDDSSFTTNMRQKVIYVPAERRMIELNGDFPINEITLRMYYRNVDGDLKEVPIPFGGLWDIKIGFYLKQ